MFRLDQHIELLLLNHECVIVPDFGGFVVHHIPSHLDEKDGMMLPPKSIVGFNQKLTVNDSLLIQSYIDSYDLSYPEAQREIEAEIEELRNMIEEYGFYDIRSIGRLSINKQGVYEFSPTEAGILVPGLYGLCGIDTTDSSAFLTKKDLAAEPSFVAYNDEDEERFIKISTNTIRNIAVACIAVILLITIPLTSNNEAKKWLSSIDTDLISRIIPNDMVKKDAPAEKKVYHVYVSKKAEVTNAPKSEEIDNTNIEAPSENPHYVVVLAARITQKNAEAFAKTLTESGMDDVRIIGEGKSRKVVCGSYANEEDAQQRRRELSEKKDFENVWITQVK